MEVPISRTSDTETISTIRIILARLNDIIDVLKSTDNRFESFDRITIPVRNEAYFTNME